MNAPLLFAVPEATTYFCPRCSEVKLESAFIPSERRKTRGRRRCKACFSAYNKAHRGKYVVRNRAYARQWRKKNPERMKMHRLKETYGITLDEYRGMLVAQDFKCAVNGESISEASGQVEHDHATGKIRGVACGSCNRTLGDARDDIARLVACAEYLSRHRGKA